MATRDFVIELIFLSQNIFGILGNFSLLYHYLFLHFTGCRLRSTDLITEYLLIANSLVMFSTGTPRTMEVFGWKYFLNECKIVYYIQRVARGVSIGSICLLRVCQAITISPRNSRWGQLKMKAPKYIGSTIFLCWVVRMLINIRFTSVSMVFILDSHKQSVQYIHRIGISSRFSLEPRATQSILVLVSTFVSLYSVSSIFHISQLEATEGRPQEEPLPGASGGGSRCFQRFQPRALTGSGLPESGERTRVDSKGKLDVRLREELIVLSLS
ncbi:vomeronasal type-1 receptor 4-like [Bos mutus]|uniref:vomeronasal type-1 receptor 4-like n=1 Tax=Bos mutus TaxID=72004 RepID=UPI0038B4EB16